MSKDSYVNVVFSYLCTFLYRTQVNQDPTVSSFLIRFIALFPNGLNTKILSDPLCIGLNFMIVKQ